MFLRHAWDLFPHMQAAAPPSTRNTSVRRRCKCVPWHCGGVASCHLVGQSMAQAASSRNPTSPVRSLPNTAPKNTMDALTRRLSWPRLMGSRGKLLHDCSWSSHNMFANSCLLFGDQMYARLADRELVGNAFVARMASCLISSSNTFHNKGLGRALSTTFVYRDCLPGIPIQWGTKKGPVMSFIATNAGAVHIHI